MHLEPDDIDLAKQRIWKRLEPRLMDRGLLSQEFFGVMRQSREMAKVSRLKKVQVKERLMDVLPDRIPAAPFVPKRLWSLGLLGTLFAVLFSPLVRETPQAQASAQNFLETVDGDVTVNGVLVEGKTMIQAGDRIETGEGAMAHVFFTDDSRVTLAPESSLEVLTVWTDPANPARTQVDLRQNSGQMWTQVLNLVSQGAYFKVEFPQGTVTVTQKASFDLQVSPEISHLDVARNLVQVSVDSGDALYSGTVGQGAALLVDSHVHIEKVSEAEAGDVWWSFNMAYGKSYALTLDANYQKENIDHVQILPGNPLYSLKQFRENLQISLTFDPAIKQDLIIQQAQNRLDEAQSLLAQGDTVRAEEALSDYQDAVTEANLDPDSNSVVVALMDVAQKEMGVDAGSEGKDLLQDHLTTTSEGMTLDPGEKSTMLLYHASQQLQVLPDLIDAERYEEALAVLQEYQSHSFSLLSELESVPMEERESVVSSLLDQKLNDLQLLRAVAGMPQLTGTLAMEMNGAVLKELSVMVLSLREKQFGDLAAFFDQNPYDITVQEQLYERIKNEVPLTSELTAQLQTVEDALDETQSAPDAVVVDLKPVVSTQDSTIQDPRFGGASVPHADESQDDTQ